MPGAEACEGEAGGLHRKSREFGMTRRLRGWRAAFTAGRLSPCPPGGATPSGDGGTTPSSGVSRSSQWVRSSTRAATRWTISPARCTLPRTSARRPPRIARRHFSRMLGQTTTFTVPVSSSSVMKITPLALPGRWRTSTSPAVAARAPSCARATVSAASAPRPASRSRRNESGWARSERRSVR